MHLITREKLESVFGFKIKDIGIYETAFTHKSALHDYECLESNERLEFLGDSVLNFIVTKFLMDKYTSVQEGFLTRVRTKLVSGKCLSRIANHFELSEFILMDSKAMSQKWNMNDRILEDVFEALIGALYLDSGMIAAKNFLLSILNNNTLINFDDILLDTNYKDILMRYTQNKRIPFPVYKILSSKDKIFTIQVELESSSYGVGMNKSKKEAEQVAAFETLKTLGIPTNSNIT